MGRFPSCLATLVNARLEQLASLSVDLVSPSDQPLSVSRHIRPHIALYLLKSIVHGAWWWLFGNLQSCKPLRNLIWKDVRIRACYSSWTEPKAAWHDQIVNPTEKDGLAFIKEFDSRLSHRFFARTDDDVLAAPSIAQDTESSVVYFKVC